MRLGFLAHAFHFILCQPGGSCDGDVLAASAGLVLGGNLQNAVDINVKGNFDLRNATRGWRDAIQDEFPERLVIQGHGPLTLQNMDFDLGLAVTGSREDLALAGRDGGVAFDLRSGNTAQRFDRKGEGGDVEQKDVFHFPAQYTRLDGRAYRYYLVGVDTFMGLLAKIAPYSFLHSWHARHPAHHHNPVSY